MKFKIRPAKNGIVLKVEHGFGDEEPEEIVYQRAMATRLRPSLISCTSSTTTTVPRQAAIHRSAFASPSNPATRGKGIPPCRKFEGRYSSLFPRPWETYAAVGASPVCFAASPAGAPRTLSRDARFARRLASLGSRFHGAAGGEYPSALRDAAFRRRALRTPPAAPSC